MSPRMTTWGAVAAVGLALAGTLTPAAVVAATPGNDDVGSATAITAIPFDDVVEVGEATVEDGEPTETCAPFANTVWYVVTPPDTTDVFVDTAGSNYDTAVAVWVGSSFADVELVACNDDTFGGLQAAVGFTAEAGTAYLVQVGAYVEAPPEALLAIHVGEPPKTTGKPYIDTGGIHGSLAEASVEHFDEVTGTYSSRRVQVLDGSGRSKGSRPVRVSQLSLSSYEDRFDETAGSYTWTQWVGFADLDPSQFAVDHRLGSAWVDAELTMYGQTCTESPVEFDCVELGSVDVTVAVTWEGEGPTVTNRERSAEDYDVARFRHRTNVRYRTAVVDGGATGGMDLDFTDAPGTIVSGADGQWSWYPAGSGFLGAAGSFAMLAEQSAPIGPQVDSSRFSGGYANAFDEVYDEADGSFTYRDVTVHEGRTRTRGGRWYPIADVSVYSTTQWFDETTNTSIGEEWFGSGPLIDGSIDRRLDRATATADVTLWGTRCTYDWDDGTSDCTDLGESSVSVAVDWTGVGPTFTSSYSSDSQVDSQHVRFVGRSTNRAAVASGSVVGGVLDWDLVDADGSMGRNADGYWSKS